MSKMASHGPLFFLIVLLCAFCGAVGLWVAWGPQYETHRLARVPGLHGA